MAEGIERSIELIGFGLTDEQQALRERAHTFAEREIRPIAAGLDRIPDATEIFPWDMLKKASQLGLRTLAVPEEYGGQGIDMFTQVTMIEAMAFADSACAKIISHVWKACGMLAAVGTKEQQDRFFPLIRDDDTFVMSFGMTEPDAGTDNALPFDDPRGGFKLSAVRDGDHYVLNGRKQWISMGNVSKLFFVAARTDRNQGIVKGGSWFLMPADTPGFTRGAVRDKLGWRAYTEADLIFENVRLPAENLLGGSEGLGGKGQDKLVSHGETEISAHMMGVSRAAYELAVEYAREHTQAGKPLIEHEAIALILGEMRVELESGRAYLFHVARRSAKGEASPASALGVCAKSVRAVDRLTSASLTVHGAAGLATGMPIEKLRRDALTLQHATAFHIELIKMSKHLGDVDMVELELDDEQQALRMLAREFADREIRPIAAELDQLPAVSESFPAALLKTGSELGLRTLAVPEEHGGQGIDVFTQILMVDEMAQVDSSCARVFSDAWRWSNLLAAAGTKEQQDRFFGMLVKDPALVAALAVSEADVGEDGSPTTDGPSTLTLSAVRDGDDYVLNGAKQRVPWGNVATLFVVDAQIDEAKEGPAGVGWFVLPSDAAGISVGPARETVGWRVYTETDLTFDNVRVPVENLLGGSDGIAAAEKEQILGHVALEQGAYALAIARAGYEVAVEFARQRVQGGRPIIEHQAVALMLGEMHMELESARLHLWHVARLAAQHQADLASSLAACAGAMYVVDMVTSETMAVHGGMGIAKEVSVEKLKRDALFLQHSTPRHVMLLRLGRQRQKG